MAEKEYNVSWPGWNVAGIIGYGSYGKVYEIERDVFGHTEKAALKVISIPQNSGEIAELYNDGYDSESITQRFKSHLKEIVREYALMSEMKGHTNIVYCDDLRYIQHDDGIGWDIYIKMELLTPLPKILGNGFSEKLVIKLGLDICNALILCKSKNIVHRDIKPQNIFVSEDKNFKLGDFGIAKTAERTTSGTKTGTYKYMAPEVYNNQPYGHSADIYSLGMVLYWLLNERRTPFLPLPPQVPTAADEERARDSRFAGFPVPEPIHGSEALKRIVLKACAFWPEERYKSAAEMRKDLLALASNGRYISQSQYIKSTGENGSRQRISAVDTDETVGNFGRVPKEETVSEKTVGVFARNTANERPRTRRKKNWLLILIGSMLCLVVLFLAFTVGSAISYLHSAEKSKERNTELLVNTQPESGETGTIIATESTAAPEESTEVPTTGTTEDPAEMANREQYARAEALLADGKEMEAALIFRALGGYQDSAQRSFNIQIQQNPGNAAITSINPDCIIAISAGPVHTVALYADGTANAVVEEDHNRGQGNLSTWTDIVAISAGSFHTIGLKSDGTVVATGSNDKGQCDVSEWTDIVAISAGPFCSVGLKSDGTVVIAGDTQSGYTQYNLSEVTDIVSIDASDLQLNYLTSDGTWGTTWGTTYKIYGTYPSLQVVKSGDVEDFGLTSDGAVLINTHYNGNAWIERNALKWTNIIDIDGGDYHIVGVKSDGSVCAAGKNDQGQCNVSDWADITMISAKNEYTVGLKGDGTIIATGVMDGSPIDVSPLNRISTSNSGDSTTDTGRYHEELLPDSEKDDFVLGVIVNTDQYVNVRQGPGMGYEIVGAYLPGTTVKIFGTTMVGSDEWVRVPLGWISQEYVKIEE